MSFRTGLFIFIASLLAALLAIQWGVMRSFAGETEQKFGEAAFSISQETARVFVFSGRPSRAVAAPDAGQTGSQSSWRWNRDTRINLTLSDRTNAQFIELRSNDDRFQIPIPRQPIEEAIDSLRAQLLWSTALTMLAGIVIAALFAHWFTRPLQALNRAAIRIGEGHFGTLVNDTYGTGTGTASGNRTNRFNQRDLSATIDTFNSMSVQLKNHLDLQRQQQQQAHAAELGEVARGLAHNLRNPLNTLSLASDQLSDPNAPHAKIADYQALVRRQIQRIDQWIRSFMLLMDKGLDTESIDLKATLEQLSAELSDANRTKASHSQAMAINLEQVPSLQLRGCEPELRSVFETLAINAIDAGAKKLDIKAKQSNEGLKLSFSDNGQGLAGEVLAQLFKPHNTNKSHGSGMGLYLARSIVKGRYRGNIELESSGSEGSVFIVTLRDRVSTENTIDGGDSHE